MYGLICFSLLDRCKVEGKPIDFLPIWLCVDPLATFIFIALTQGRKAEVCHFCYFYGNRDRRSQDRSCCLREGNAAQQKSTWHEILPDPLLSVSLPGSQSFHHLFFVKLVVSQAASQTSSSHFGGINKSWALEVPANISPSRIAWSPVQIAGWILKLFCSFESRPHP